MSLELIEWKDIRYLLYRNRQNMALESQKINLAWLSLTILRYVKLIFKNLLFFRVSVPSLFICDHTLFTHIALTSDFLNQTRISYRVGQSECWALSRLFHSPLSYFISINNLYIFYFKGNRFHCKIKHQPEKHKVSGKVIDSVDLMLVYQGKSAGRADAEDKRDRREGA